MPIKKKLNIEICHQGAIQVNEADVVAFGYNIIAAYIDLTSKYAEVSGSYSGGGEAPVVYLCASERTLHLHPDREKNGPTGIKFPGLIGWEVFSAEVGRYTLSIALIKRKK